jgi:hypothetical protein
VVGLANQLGGRGRGRAHFGLGKLVFGSKRVHPSSQRHVQRLAPPPPNREDVIRPTTPLFRLLVAEYVHAALFEVTPAPKES